MAIYTKTGDSGKTALFGGKRVSKYDLQVEAYGAVDEATSFIGFAEESLKKDDDKKLLNTIQMNLYSIMAYLSSGPFEEKKIQEQVVALEKNIDELEKLLPPLTRFILPQGSESASRFHLARVMVRSAERRIVAFLDTKKEQDQKDMTILQYINRLSDFLFMMARKYSEGEIVT